MSVLSQINCIRNLGGYDHSADMVQMYTQVITMVRVQKSRDRGSKYIISELGKALEFACMNSNLNLHVNL